MKVGIERSDRKQLADKVSVLLADSYTLYLKTHNFHWNVTGPMFPVLHTLFEEQYTDLAEAVDEIAERIRALGFKAPGAYSTFAKLTHIEEETGDPSAEQMVQQLLDGHETIVRYIRDILDDAAQADDESTADLLTQRIAVHEKTAWMLRSYLGK